MVAAWLPWIVLLASATTAYVVGIYFSDWKSAPFRVMVFLLIWTVLLIFPVQVLAALQIAGLVDKVTIPEGAIFQLVLLAIALGWSRFRPISKKQFVRSTLMPRRPIPWYLSASAAALAISYGLFALNLLTSYPFGWDSVSYHLPIAVSWLQQGSLQLPASRVWRLSLSGNGEVLMMLLLDTGRQALASCFNWISAIALACASYEIIKKMGHENRNSRIAAVLIVLSIPIVQFQTFMDYVDLFATAFLIAAVAVFLSRYRDSGQNTQELSVPVVALSALACGVSIGTKAVFYLYGALFFAIVIAMLFRERAVHKRSMLLLTGVMITGVLLPSAFWFGRNYHATANPIYPLQVSVGRKVIFAGYEPSQINTASSQLKFVSAHAGWLIYPWTEGLRHPNAWMQPYSEGGGLGAAFATFVPVGLGFLIYCILRRRFCRRADILLLLIWFLLLACWWTVLHQTPRYGLPMLVLACVLSTAFLSALFRTESNWAGLLLTLSIISTVVISSSIPAQRLFHRIRTGEWSRAEFYGYPAMIDDLPNGTHVLNDTGFMTNNFVLAGKRLNNIVIATAELPPRLTNEFVAKESVDYIVQASSNDERQERVAPIPNSIPVSEVATEQIQGTTWHIWKVIKRDEFSSSAPARH
ncbi:MAG TPA: hypothetical protein VFI95_05205 [Terriglobales bacterium]|nr:hypothetical protein [Terriglobales bacterium]